MSKLHTMHRKGFPKTLAFMIVVLLAASLACNLPIGRLWAGQQDQGNPPPQSDSGADDKQPGNGQNGGAATATTQLELPTATPSPTASLTPTSTLTPTPYVIIAGNTNCRYGPGSVYDLLYTYLAGAEAILLGKDAAEEFWYTQDGTGVSPDCWLWNKYATPVGDTSLIPVFTPPPTPTPFLSFSVSYQGDDCGAGSCGFWFQVNNTGVLPLESVRVYVKNTTTSADSTYTSNVFQTGIMGGDIANVPFASSGYTHSNLIPNPSGATVNANIKVCSQNDLGGICLVKTVVINP